MQFLLFCSLTMVDFSDSILLSRKRRRKKREERDDWHHFLYLSNYMTNWDSNMPPCCLDNVACCDGIEPISFSKRWTFLIPPHDTLQSHQGCLMCTYHTFRLKLKTWSHISSLIIVKHNTHIIHKINNFLSIMLAKSQIIRSSSSYSYNSKLSLFWIGQPYK